ncbi:aminodeoxychorismate lyase [soil metagenome]
MFVSVNGIAVEKNHALIPAVSDGLFYGTGCFETLKSYRGAFLHFDKHVDRLNAGVKYLTSTTVDYYSADTLRKEVTLLLKANKLDEEDSVVRIQGSLSDRMGYRVSENFNILMVITSDKIKPITSSQKLTTSDITVIPSSCKPPHLKLSNMLHYRDAGIKAKNNGYDDALMLTVNRNVAETSIGNLFWESDDIVYTPSIECDILHGITRSVVIELLEKMDIQVEEGEYSRAELMKSQHVWMTNSVREIVKVSEIDDQKFATDSEIFDRLVNEFKRYKQDHLK